MSDLATSCSALALRQAARHVSQLYDRCLAEHALTSNQFSILQRLAELGPCSTSRLARALRMDRSTLTRNLQPLQREELLLRACDLGDRRHQLLDVSSTGRDRLEAATASWLVAQQRFESAFGESQSAAMRALVQAVAELEFI